MFHDKKTIRLVWRAKLSVGLMSVALMVAAASSTAIAREAWSLPDFSATEVRHLGGGQMTWKVYHSGSNFRVEMAPGEAFIFASSADKVYRVLLKGTQCIETPAKQARPMSPLQLLSGAEKVQRKPTGTDVVEGHACKVENVTVTGADGTKTALKVWEAQDLKGMPLKIELHSGLHVLVTTYRDIVVGAPAKALFKRPDNCKPFDKMYRIAPD
jgi:hypothetical protein